MRPAGRRLQAVAYVEGQGHRGTREAHQPPLRRVPVLHRDDPLPARVGAGAPGAAVHQRLLLVRPSEFEGPTPGSRVQPAAAQGQSHLSTCHMLVPYIISTCSIYNQYICFYKHTPGCYNTRFIYFLYMEHTGTFPDGSFVRDEGNDFDASFISGWRSRF